jgi:hypothetical protein
VSSILNACANGGFKDPLLLATLSKEATAFPAGTSLQHIACAANALVSYHPLRRIGVQQGHLERA